MAVCRSLETGVRGVRRETLGGVHKIQPGVWGGGGGAVSPPAGSGAELRKILKLMLFRALGHLFP